MSVFKREVLGFCVKSGVSFLLRNHMFSVKELINVRVIKSLYRFAERRV